ncbi:MAG: S8 family serine peptidase [Flavobacterium sp.]|uniref:S8 family serine peptidase n=1 Tax=Flavobacterium sp. TaxID=239 RepID=UPI00352967FF
MKVFFLLLLSPFFIVAQTTVERKKISDSYNKELFSKLKNDAISYEKQQTDSIALYKKQHNFVDSEKKSLQKIENGLPIFYTTYNQGSSHTIGTDKMYPNGSLGLNVTGEGMTAGVWDEGKVRTTHVEFAGNKVTLGDDAVSFNNHSTHVTGTIVALGVSPLRRGIAYGAHANTYDWDSDYSEMLDFGSAGFLTSNHSYGYVATSLPISKFGSYDVSSIEVDNVSNANPYYQIVIAAGNDRDDFTIDQVGNKGGYDLLTGKSNAKNAIVVAAVNQVDNYFDSSSVEMSTFSNFGPTDDGRIKPDISAKGVGVSSTISTSNIAYDTYQGTSMATPAITGMILLLQKHFSDMNFSSYMRASTVRGLICHSAKEAGFYPGPDYEYGWGLANAEAAANIITNKNISTVLEENTLTNNQIFTKQITLDSAQKLSATICWTDPTGASNGTAEDNRTPRLKNNLDLKILKNGQVYFPWKLNVEDVAAPATNDSDNNVDNIEKVEIENAQPGVYTIQVSHKATLTGGSQVFSLIANGSTGINLNTSNYDFDKNVFIYPNPTTNTLNYSINDAISIDSIRINDVSGKAINNFKADLNHNNIDVSNLSSGIYFVTFVSEQSSVTKKFVKQ